MNNLLGGAAVIIAALSAFAVILFSRTFKNRLDGIDHNASAALSRMLNSANHILDALDEVRVSLSTQLETLTPENIALENTKNAINAFTQKVFDQNVEAGWWTDLDGNPLTRNFGEMLALVHSEISEALEGDRKDLMDDKLPNRKMTEVELADAVIRIADIAGSRGMDLGGAIVDKLKYNRKRKDHKPEERAKKNGKKY